MPLYNTVLYIPPIQPPRAYDCVTDSVQFKDERHKIAELESAFEEYETELSVKVRPLPPRRGPFSIKRVFRALGLATALSGAGLLGYRLFVFTPSYKGPEQDLKRKTILITEPTTKFSRELLHSLIQRDAHLILATNSIDKCQDLRDQLLRKTKINSDLIECRRLELDSMTSIRRFVASLIADYSKLDQVILQSSSCVSGIVAGNKRFTHDGFEYQLGTNYFANYLLACLLLKCVNQTQGRLIFVLDTQASNLAEKQNIQKSTEICLPIENLNWEQENTYDPKLAYQRSQWFFQLFANELARRNYGEDKASIFIVDPRISRGTAPVVTTNTTSVVSMKRIQDTFTRICDWAARLITRKTSATTIFCSIADSNDLELSGQQKQSDQSSLKLSNPIIQAPVYQDLRLFHSFRENKKNVTNQSDVEQLLWAISEKWTRLDTHPNALPLPPKTK